MSTPPSRTYRAFNAVAHRLDCTTNPPSLITPLLPHIVRPPPSISFRFSIEYNTIELYVADRLHNQSGYPKAGADPNRMISTPLLLRVSILQGTNRSISASPLRPFHDRSTSQARLGLMGNAGAKALAQPCPYLNEKVLLRLHRQFLEAGDGGAGAVGAAVDRAAFASLLSPETGLATSGRTELPYRFIDQLFDAILQCQGSTATENGVAPTDSIDYPPLAFSMLLAAPGMDIELKCRLLYQLAVPAQFRRQMIRSDKFAARVEVSLEELFNNVERLIAASLGTLNGTEQREGLREYPNRLCTGCGEVPRNAAFECEECFAASGSIVVLGIPLTVHLCSNCVGSWEGTGLLFEMRHQKQHTVRQVKRAPNPHQPTHLGYKCEGCGVEPIVGTRYRCTDCVDLVSLCSSCYQSSESPLGHSNIHHTDALHFPVTSIAVEVREHLSLVAAEIGRSFSVPKKGPGQSPQRHSASISSAAPTSTALIDPNVVAAYSGGGIERYTHEDEFVKMLLGQSERAVACLSGFRVHHIPLNLDPEILSIEVTEEVIIH
jgi:hypothetical protein